MIREPYKEIMNGFIAFWPKFKKIIKWGLIIYLGFIAISVLTILIISQLPLETRAIIDYKCERLVIYLISLLTEENFRIFDKSMVAFIRGILSIILGSYILIFNFYIILLLRKAIFGSIQSAPGLGDKKPLFIPEQVIAGVIAFFIVTHGPVSRLIEKFALFLHHPL